MLKCRILLIILLILGPGLVPSLALDRATRSDTIGRPGDFHLISRNASEIFVGSHKLFQDEMRGMTKVSYCGRAYFVRTHSVAWVQVETERGNTVRIEYNSGRGWRPICGNPEGQVTLTDLGITISAREVLASTDENAPGKSRLSAIGALFKASTQDDGENSFHN